MFSKLAVSLTDSKDNYFYFFCNGILSSEKKNQLTRQRDTPGNPCQSKTVFSEPLPIIVPSLRLAASIYEHLLFTCLQTEANKNRAYPLPVRAQDKYL